MNIIAECGCNWHSLDEAKLMIRKAHDIGCWAAKFQLFSEQYAEAHHLPRYLSLSKGSADFLFDCGNDAGIEVFFTPFDVERVEWCEEIDVNYYKIRFADRNNKELIDRVDLTDKPFFISSDKSMGYLEGIDLYCVPTYPANIADYDNEAIMYFTSISDHTADLRLLKISKFYGFEWFEKHVKLNDNCLESAWSVTFEELAEVLQE